MPTIDQLIKQAKAGIKSTPSAPADNTRYGEFAGVKTKSIPKIASDLIVNTAKKRYSQLTTDGPDSVFPDPKKYPQEALDRGLNWAYAMTGDMSRIGTKVIPSLSPNKITNTAQKLFQPGDLSTNGQFPALQSPQTDMVLQAQERARIQKRIARVLESMRNVVDERQPTTELVRYREQLSGKKNAVRAAFRDLNDYKARNPGSFHDDKFVDVSLDKYQYNLDRARTRLRNFQNKNNPIAGIRNNMESGWINMVRNARPTPVKTNNIPIEQRVDDYMKKAKALTGKNYTELSKKELIDKIKSVGSSVDDSGIVFDNSGNIEYLKELERRPEWKKFMEDHMRRATPEEYISKIESQEFVDLVNNALAKNNKSQSTVTIEMPRYEARDIPVNVKYQDGKIASSGMVVGVTPDNYTVGLKDSGYENLPNWMKILLREKGPGMNMRNTTMNNILEKSRTGGSTGLYKSINDAMRQLELGTIKSGDTGYSNSSRPLWENIYKKGGIGYYNFRNGFKGAMSGVVPLGVFSEYIKRRQDEQRLNMENK